MKNQKNTSRSIETVFVKSIVMALIAFLTPFNVFGYVVSQTANGTPYHWPEGEIDVYLDPSLMEINEIAPAVIENAFEEWLDHIEYDITLNYIYDECDPFEENCIYFKRTDVNCGSEKELACAFVTNKPNGAELTGISIEFHDVIWYVPGEEEIGCGLREASLHEIGHFFGMAHSYDPAAVMYWIIPKSDGLTNDDISGIHAIYDHDWPKEVKTGERYVSKVNCSMSPSKTVVNLLKLLF